MFLGVISLLWLLISLMPSRTNPEFVVREIKACCHHQIGLQCENRQARLAIIQARFLLATTVEFNSKSWLEGDVTPSESIALSDMDVKFVHNLMHEGKENKLFELNSPEWMKQNSFDKSKLNRIMIRRYTTPNPIPSGFNFTSNRVLEVPPYEKKFLDKDTIWNQALLFQQGEAETWLQSNSSRFDRSEPARVRPCLSYESLSMTNNSESKAKIKKPAWEYKDLRPVFNRRCSGKSECIVNLLRNKQKDQDFTRVCQKWPDGRLIVKYVCLNSDDVHSNCDEDVNPAQEGFILSPSYPDLYPGDRPCQWRLHVEQQRLLLVFLDISLRGKEKSRCRDELTVNEDLANLLSICGDQDSAVAILSPSHRINVTFIPESRFAFPKRGFLLYFRAIGCTAPGTQKNAYLVSRNATHANFHCELGYFLPKSFSQSRWLKCHPLSRTWISEQPECVDVKVLLGTELSIPTGYPSNRPVLSRSLLESIISDYILPISVLLFILIGNGFVLLWIRTQIQIQRRKKFDTDEDQEMDVTLGESTPEESTFTLSSDGMGTWRGTKPGGKPWDFLELTDLEEKTPLMNNSEREETDGKNSVSRASVPNGNGGIFLHANGTYPLPLFHHHSSNKSESQHNGNGNFMPYRFTKTTPV